MWVGVFATELVHGTLAARLVRDVLATEIVVEVFAAELVVEILVALVVRGTFSRYAIGHSGQLPAALTAFSRHRRDVGSPNRQRR